MDIKQQIKNVAKYLGSKKTLKKTLSSRENIEKARKTRWKKDRK